jgi:hypothetical protein
MRILRKFLSLPIRDQRLLVSAIFLSFFFKIALRCLSLNTLLNLCSKVHPVFSPSLPPVPTTDKVVWAVSTAAKRIPGVANCLTEALTAKFLLALEGHSSVLEIGVKTGHSGRLKAHAWLKMDGAIIVGSSDRSDYVALPQFDGEKG